MSLSTVRFYLKLGVLSILLTPNLAAAQVVPDSTLSIESSILNQGNTIFIEGGTVSGSSLFHSFEQFSIPGNNSAYFNNALDIQNIFSRVTGSSISKINGVIQANGTANIFLVNPNGIVFGSGAMLNVGGSFLASTASSINFADGSQFSAKSPQSSLLTISVPVGLKFGSNPGTIQVQGTGHDLTLQNPILSPFTQNTSLNGLQVGSGKTLALIGGEIQLKGGLITAPGGRIELGAAENGSVSLNQVVNGWDLEYEGISSFKNIQLSLQSLLDASGSGNGSIHIQGGEVKFMDGSVALIQNQGSLPSGTLKINAELLEINGISLDGTIPSSIVSEAVQSGNGADINISTRVLSVEEGARISTRTYSSGNGGNLLINASEAVNANSFSPVNPQLFTYIASATLGTGNGGEVKITTDQLNSKDGGSIGSLTLSLGKGGRLSINTNNINLDGISPTSVPSSLFAINAGSGQSSDSVINTSKLTLTNGSVISSSTLSSGNSGNIVINASDSIQLEGVENLTNYNTSINSGTGSQPQFLQELLQPSQEFIGDSGNITINTRQLKMTNNANLSSITVGAGDAGDITINASDSINIVNSSVSSSSRGKGKSGNINIDTKNLETRDGGQILVVAFDSGDGGNLNVNVTDSIKITGITPNGMYSSGLYASSYDTGASGNLNISTSSISLDNRGQIETTTIREKGGNIQLQADNLQLRNGSRISADANVLGELGDGGNITINTNTLIALENSEIVATAFNGSGGNIQIYTRGIFLSPDSKIDASSERGFDGVVDIQTLGFEIENGITPLQGNFITSEQVVAGSCLARRNADSSSFVVTGSGNLPTNPESEPHEWESLSKPTTLSSERLQDAPDRNLFSTRPWKIGDPIVEAQSIVRLPNGRVLLGSKSQKPVSAESIICKT